MDKQGPPRLDPKILLPRIQLPFLRAPIEPQTLCEGDAAADVDGIICDGGDGSPIDIQYAGKNGRDAWRVQVFL